MSKPTSMLFQFIFELGWERDENKQKEAGIGPLKYDCGTNLEMPYDDRVEKRRNGVKYADIEAVAEQ